MFQSVRDRLAEEEAADAESNFLQEPPPPKRRCVGADAFPEDWAADSVAVVEDEVTRYLRDAPTVELNGILSFWKNEVNF